MWECLISLIILDDRVRLSRLATLTCALLAVLIFGYGLIAPNSFWVGTALAVALASLGVGLWKLGNWWCLRQLLRKAQDGMPMPIRQRGFEVIPGDKQTHTLPTGYHED